MDNVSPSNPGQEGSSEVLHDGMNDAGHNEQLHGNSQGENGGSGSSASESGDN